MSVQDYDTARGAVSPGISDQSQPEITKIELADITERQTWGDRSIITRTSESRKAKQEDERYREYALVLRRLVDRDGGPKSTCLEARSKFIREGLKEVLGDYSGVNMESIPIVIPKPYAPIFHYRKELRAYASHESRSEDEKTHMQVLVDFMNKNLQEVERAYDRLLPSDMISCDILWTIFRPEDIIVARRDHFVESYMVDSYTIAEASDSEIAFSIGARSWDYNGVRFGPMITALHIHRFVGNKKIEALEVYPIAFHREPDGSDVKKNLISRGLKWRKIVDVTHKEYNALAWTDPLTEDADSFQKLIPIHVSGRIILDYATHQQAKPLLATILSKSSAIAEVDPNDLEDPQDPAAAKARKRDEDRSLSHLNDSNYKMTEEQALLCPARVRGFSLTEKIWAFFLVDEVKDITWSPDAFAILDLDENFKKTIEALVNIHGNAEKGHEKFDDVIAGKGRGLVFLLTGPPGLGKSLTAESIAEHTQKPLYAITSGELGTNVVDTDQRLRRIFNRAKTWNAILLLDEADVFLSKREGVDLERNAFVSIFLRLIEYYEGILFLTTNRVGDFDEAFKSRIHLTIDYPDLTPERRTRIWKNLLERVRPGSWSTETLDHLGANYEVNGREIKNLIRTALALATHQGVPLAEEHIRDVYNLNCKAVASIPLRSPLKRRVSFAQPVLIGRSRTG